MATTHTREECMLGTVFAVVLDDDETGDRVTRTTYLLNVIDGWVHEQERADESGVVWESSTPWRKAPVKEVMDAAPDCMAFIVNSTLKWIQALQAADLGHHAGAQRRALENALHHHGLALTAETKQALAEHAAQARRARRKASNPARARAGSPLQAEP